MTIKEVAKLAGVSPASISRYLNGGPLSEEKRAVIRKVIEETGYRPDPMAQTMRTGRGEQIGVIVPRIDSDSVSQIVAGISSRLRDRNYLTILGCTDYDRDRELRYIETMQNSQVAGMILMGSNLTPALREAIEMSAKPIVITGQNFVGLPCVYHDDYGAMQALTQRIVHRGRRHILYIGATEEDPAAGKARRAGFMDAVREAGLDVRSNIFETTADFTPESGEKAMRLALMEHAEIDGVICATDRMALGAIKALEELGRRIPEDVSIAGVGDSWVNSVARPALTTAHLYYRQCGEVAVDMLLRIINEGDDGPAMQARLQYTIVDRASI